MMKLFARSKGSKKGQIFAYDAIIAGALFAVLLAVLFVYWDAIRSLVFVQVDDMFRVALRVSDNLLSPGSPADWEAKNVQQLGLAEKYGTVRISEQKMINLGLISYDSLRSMLGVGVYEVYVSLTSPTETLEAGVYPPGYPPKVSIKKPVVYKDNPANLTILIWAQVPVS
jgi:hypothetical protein